jgi:hypothetical protein
MDASMQAVEEFYNDPVVKIHGIDVEIAILQANINICGNKIKELFELRQKIIDSMESK